MRATNASRPRPMLMLLVLTGSLMAAGVWAHSEELAPEPLPFDPLDDAESAYAMQLAEDDPQVTTALGARYQPVGAALNTDKRDVPPSEWTRRADVWFYSYTFDTGLHVLVDLDHDTVLAVTPIDHQPPLTADEAARAGALAQDDPRVASTLPPGEIATAAHLRSAETGPCALHRCVEVAFFVDDTPWFPYFVIVDLSTETVVELLDNPGYVPWDAHGDHGHDHADDEEGDA